MLAERRSQSHKLRQFEFEFQAIERERRRVAKELHDEILPSLARLIRSIQSQNPEQLHDAVIQELHNLVAGFRDVLGELHPVDLEELGLVPGLNNICARYTRLTGLSIIFNETSEESALSDLQELCLYRAMQAVLRMFAASGNDVLLVGYGQDADESLITFRCVDKILSPREWLSGGNPEYDVFESLCSMAGSKIEIGAVCPEQNEYPYDLVLRTAPIDRPLSLSPAPKNAELFKNLAVEAERKRISDDLNTIILPHLDRTNSLADTSSNILLSMAVRDRMQLITAEVKAVIGEAHSQLLEQTGLVPSIMTLVDRFTRASYIETTIAADLSSADVNITPDAKFAIYRATQEALNNVEKHSAATLARIAVRRDPDALVVEIEDNGKGLEQQTSTQSRGLKIIRERAEAIGAHVRWQKAASFETGTLVCISLPYNR
jgi:signal transduction histidine kinase